MRVTIREIAKACHVSHAAVSMSLRDHPRIGSATRRRVKACARRLGYVPNRMAQRLKTGKSMTFGHVLPSLTSPYLALIADHLFREAFRFGYQIQFVMSEDDVEQESEAIDECLKAGVDGLILNSCIDYKKELSPGHSLRRVVEDRRPCVAIGQMPICPTSVRFDIRLSSYLATSHLLQGGCRNVRLLTGGPREGEAFRKRRQGFQDALREMGMEMDPSWVISEEIEWETLEQQKTPSTSVVRHRCFDYSRVGVYGARLFEHALQLRGAGPLGLVCSNDQIAASVWGSCAERNLRVPHEVQIVGCDDTLGGGFPMTSVRWDYEEAAQRTISLLLMQIAGKQIPAIPLVKCALVVRYSSRPPVDGRST